MRFALRYAPCILACEFESTDGNLGTVKLEFKNVSADTSASEMLDMVTTKLGEVVQVDKIDNEQLEALVKVRAVAVGLDRRSLFHCRFATP